MAQGTIKDYDIGGRVGSLLQDDHTEVAIDAASTEGSGIRYLRIGQRVVFDVVDESGRKMARNLKIISFSLPAVAPSSGRTPLRIDAHAHVLQESWVGEPWWQGLSRLAAAVLPGVSPEMVREGIVPSYFDEDGSAQLGSMEAGGIDMAVMFPYDWTTEEHLGQAAVGWQEQNAWYRTFARERPDRIRWGFGADPRQPGALDAFDRAVRDEGAVCLKLHPSNGFPIDDPAVYPFMEGARSLNVPVVIHTGPIAGPLYSKWSQPILLDQIAADFPGLKIPADNICIASW